MTYSITNDDIHIVMCSYKRVCNIPNIINSLNKQSVSHKIYLHILNNNKTEISTLNKIVKQPSIIKILIKHYNNDNNVFERFIYSKYLYQSGITYIIYIDDDMLYIPTWVEQMYNMRKPKHFITWYVKLFLHDNKFIDYNNKTNDSIIVNYSKDSIIKYYDVRKDTNLKYKYGNYGGPGGSIIDASIFNNDDFFILPNNDIKLMDDIWLSYYLINKLNWTIERSFLCPILIWNKITTTNALYNVISKMKNKYFSLFVNNKLIK